MQLLGRLMDRALKARGKRATIVAATSGDTGAAAMKPFGGWIRSMSSFSIRMAASPTCSAAR